jgi:hypothetical protein
MALGLLLLLLVVVLAVIIIWARSWSETGVKRKKKK